MYMKNIIIKTHNTVSCFLTMLMASMLLAILPITANAHALQENSARIILRDGQVEVRILVDISRWRTRLQNSQAWLFGDIKRVMPANLTASETSEFLDHLLNEEIKLMLNNKKVALTLLTTSSMPSIANKTIKHHEYTELVLSAKHTHSLVKQLNIRFPKSLGAVHTSFSKPQYQLVAAGNNVQVSF